MLLKYKDELSAGHIDYRLNIIGIRVWENECQIIARLADEWLGIGHSYTLPLEVPQSAWAAKALSSRPILVAAWQCATEIPDSDIREVLEQRKPFLKALTERRKVA